MLPITRDQEFLKHLNDQKVELLEAILNEQKKTNALLAKLVPAVPEIKVEEKVTRTRRKGEV